MADLQELFSRLKAQSSESPQPTPPPITIAQRPQSQNIWAQQQPAGYQPPTVSSPLMSPPVHTPNPIHSSAIISPVGSNVGSPAPGQHQQQDRANNLLNLLKFNNSGGAASGALAGLQNVPQRSTSIAGSKSQQFSAEELVGGLQQRPASSSLPFPPFATSTEKQEATTGPPANTQDFLLNLLTKPKKPSDTPTSQSTGPVQNQPSDQSLDRLAQSFATASIEQQKQRETTPVHLFGSVDSPKTTFEAPQPTKSAKFNYVNPFDQLQASSPLPQTRKPDELSHSKKIEILKHERDASSGNNGEVSAAPATKSRKLESPAAGTKESVSEALEEVGGKVDKQVEEALEQAETKAHAAEKAARVKKEGKNDNDNVDSSWESAEDSEAAKEESGLVKVYNFPMKPFVSIKVKLPTPTKSFSPENFMSVAQLKKEFDQMDRCLATASQTHIVYAQTATRKDNGGFRIIRQDTGDHKQVYRSTGERIFNVQICSPPTTSTTGGDVETVLGTGVDGTVFWTSLAKSRGDLFQDDDIEAQGFLMPPISTAEENTSGSPVKTRARVSNRHPEYFALARGKTIYLVSPDIAKDPVYLDRKTRIVNSEKYFADHTLKISTGKAGKDFCFSEDDSTLVSLDKGGRIKFWDIRDLTAQASDAMAPTHEPVELKDPLWSLITAASGSKLDEKPSVSSIMFLDKDRPTAKGVALRYLIVGFKQNHILQLWDLGLGKAVQELRLPHDKDSDGICSISFSAKTSIVTVGHPTRNSIYFIHLSAPRYTLKGMSQAEYIAMLARSDPALPRVESTAIMSGAREFTFAKTGLLRSVDMLSTPVPNATEPESENETMFELYAMHSKGVVGLGIKRRDLGWDEKSKVIKGIDADKDGLVELSPLVEPTAMPTAPTSILSDSGPTKKLEQSQSKMIPAKKDAPKKSAPMGQTLSTLAQPPPNGTAEKTSIGRGYSSEVTKQQDRALSNPPLMTADSYAMAAQKQYVQDKADSAAIEIAKAPSPPSKPSPAQAVHKEAAPPSTSATGEDYKSLLNKEFDNLYSRIESDKRVQEAAGAAKQDAMLRLVSSTLTDNVEKTLSRIVSERIAEDVIPAITSTTGEAAGKKLAEIVPQQVSAVLQAQIKSSLPQAISQALKDAEVQRIIGDQVANKVHHSIEVLLQKHMPRLATEAAQKMVADVESRAQRQWQQAEQQHKNDANKITQLTGEVRALTDAINRIAEGQLAFQRQMHEWQNAKDGAASAASTEKAGSIGAGAVDPQKQAEDEEVRRITQMLVEHSFEQATIQWLQSPNQAELFDKLFIKVNPEYLQHVSPLVALSVCAAITASFSTHVAKRLEWLTHILGNIDLGNSDIVDVAPKIMDVLSQRLQGAYMTIAEESPGDAVLRKIAGVNRKVGEVRSMIG